MLRKLVAAGVLFAAAMMGAFPATNGVATAQGDGDEDTWYDAQFDFTFPLPEGEADYVDTYWACRSGCSRYHWATDIMADKMVPAHAAADGEICAINGLDEAPPGWGYALTICGDDGIEYSYIHINNDTPGTDDGAGGPDNAYAPAVVEGGKGMRVERGEHVAYIGDSGNAESTAPHLHFEVRDPDETRNNGRYNPYPSLIAAEERGDYPDAVTPGPPAPPEEEPSEDPGEEPGGEPPAVPGAGGSAAIDRLAGSNRVETAVALSQATRDHASTVIVVPSGSHAEALVSAALAGVTGAPVLLSGPDGLDAAVRDEVERLDPLNAYVVGSEDQLGAQVPADLSGAGVLYQARVEAGDRYALSAAIARDVASYPALGGELPEVILALGDAADPGRAWPDALAASALAAHERTPILLVQADALPDAVAAVLADFEPERITVVGGTAAISDDVAEEAAGAAGGAELRRLAGATRYATSAAVADAAVAAGLDGGEAWLATGRNFPDALAAGPAAASVGAPLLLVDGTDAAGSPESSAWLQDHPVGNLVIVGGLAVISDAVAQASGFSAAG